MFEVKTNKEYQALLSEIDAIKEANSRQEEEILRLMEEIEEVKRSLGRREKEVAASLEKIEGEKQRIQEKMSQDDAGWKKQMERREVLTRQMEKKLFRLYNTLQEKRRVGVVRVKNETCQGCFLNIPPQMYIEVQKNNALIQCPHCNRILFFEGNEKGK
jgi:predicted  nucleic acid-binding Zn-ribbon protein